MQAEHLGESNKITASQVIRRIEPPKFFSVLKQGRVKGCGTSKVLTKQRFLTACGLLGGWVCVCAKEGKVLVLTGGCLES